LSYVGFTLSLRQKLCAMCLEGPCAMCRWLLKYLICFLVVSLTFKTYKLLPKSVQIIIFSCRVQKYYYLEHKRHNTFTKISPRHKLQLCHESRTRRMIIVIHSLFYVFVGCFYLKIFLFFWHIDYKIIFFYKITKVSNPVPVFYETVYTGNLRSYYSV
jgi:hypothetical protein